MYPLEPSSSEMRALVDAGHDIAFVVTQPDRRRSRGSGTDPSPVRGAAEELGLPVRTPVKAREIVDDVRASGAQLGVVVAFGQLLPVALLEALPLGFVNVHFSLLPRWRGAAPVERAIMAGDSETAVMAMRMEEGLDTGPICLAERTPIGETPARAGVACTANAPTPIAPAAIPASFTPLDFSGAPRRDAQRGRRW